MAMVFQQFNLYPHKTVLKNVTLAPVLVRRIPKEEAEAGPGAPDRVGLDHKADAYPSQLSGGQQQRVAIARALDMRPRSCCSTSPPPPWTPRWWQEVLDVMRICPQEGITMVVVTHEMGFAREVADRVIFMDGGQSWRRGRLSTSSRPPRHERTRLFLSRILR